ncbi:MAG: molybdopterin-containing oxidoreductase family protein [Desulfotomaculales bacterium]
MRRVYRSACPLDCYASCGLLVERENGRVTAIKGDPAHPLTRGRVCGKVRRLLERQYSPERLLHPLMREGSGWRRIGWDEALALWAEKLAEVKERYGTTAVLYHDASGSNGILRGLGRRFFNVYGGVTVPEGSLCWGAGLAAQALDFGGHQMHEWDDLENSRTVILWGRDPARTNIHLLPHLRRAAAGGAEIISVNPVRVRTGVAGTRHVRVRPGTDGALALAMAHVIIEEDLVDRDFVDRHVLGYPEFAASVQGFSPEVAAKICGVPAEEITAMARRYATHKPAAILFGYGMQRYANAARTVRCIDALAAITGNIGVAGGGANYVHQHWKGFFADLSGREYARSRRTFPWPALARCILAADDPPVRCIVVTRSNPLTQLPNTGLAREAFRAAGFVVVVDFFLTDTAAAADLVLPCSSFLEEEDIVVSSWNNYVSYTPKVVEPPGDCRSELAIFADLARRMGLAGFGSLSPRQWLERALVPVAPIGVDLKRLQQGPLRNPLVPRVAWADRRFPTPSGKYELFSARAAQMGLEPLPTYRPPASVQAGGGPPYPLHLLTPHHRDFTHSQFWNLAPRDKLGGLPAVEMHPETAATTGLEPGGEVWVETPRGRLKGVLREADDLRPGVVRIYQGRWAGLNGGVNLLTPDTVSDLGNGSCYYDCLCRVLPAANKV